MSRFFISGGQSIKSFSFSNSPSDEYSVTPQETQPGLPVSVQESLAEAWIDSGLLQSQGH